VLLISRSVVGPYDTTVASVASVVLTVLVSDGVVILDTKLCGEDTVGTCVKVDSSFVGDSELRVLVDWGCTTVVLVTPVVIGVSWVSFTVSTVPVVSG
jgi:hypothetical protein